MRVEHAAVGTCSTIFGFAFGLFVTTVVLEAASVELRYAKYGLLFVALLLIGASSASTRGLLPVHREYFGGLLSVMVFAIAGSLLGALLHEAVTPRFWSETFFIASPLALAYVLFPYLDRTKIPIYVRNSFLGVVAAFVIQTRLEVLGAFTDLSTLQYKVMTSQLGAESDTSFLFGLYALYFAFSGKRKWSIAAFVLVVLSFKRIAILGVLAALAGHVLLSLTRIRVERHRRKIAVGMVAINVLILLLTYELTYGYFDELLVDKTGISSDWATMGRTGVWRLVLSSIPFSTFGEGLGSITVLLQSHGMPILNAHSDILKYAVEAGPIVSCVWVFYLYWQHTRSRQLFLTAVYLNVLLITDNVSIYLPVMFLFYVFAGFLLVGEDTRAEADLGGRDPTKAKRECG